MQRRQLLWCRGRKVRLLAIASKSATAKLTLRVLFFNTLLTGQDVGNEMKRIARTLPQRMSHLSIALVVLSALLVPRSVLADVGYDSAIPQLQFAAQEIEDAVAETGRKDLMVTLTVKSDSTSPEAFQIRVTQPNRVEVIGSDASGAMYGGIEVAEFLKLGLPITNVQRKPFVAKRGIKFNIPLDARSPSYDDSGDAAQKNIANMWDFEGFWKPYLNGLARYRYNTLSLWTSHPYPHMVKLPEYPDCAEEDVYKVEGWGSRPRVKGPVFHKDFHDEGPSVARGLPRYEWRWESLPRRRNHRIGQKDDH